jgi:hypothetical protein
VGLIIIIVLVIVLPIACIWSIRIDNMNRNHPEYKGEDFLNSAGRDGWDEDLDQPAK